MKFITLTNKENFRVLINPMMITAIEALDTINKKTNAKVYTLINDAWSVKETVEEIQKLIKETENTHTITWTNTGPR